jgi:hypothetical protein
LEVGIIPEAVQQFNSWIAKLQDRIRAVEIQVKQHIRLAVYSDLADDFHLLGSLHKFIFSFLFSGKEVFTGVASSIATATNDILDKIRADWKEYHGLFLNMLKEVGPQQDGAAQEKLKTNMVGLIAKLKVL